VRVCRLLPSAACAVFCLLAATLNPHATAELVVQIMRRVLGLSASRPVQGGAHRLHNDGLGRRQAQVGSCVSRAVRPVASGSSRVQQAPRAAAARQAAGKVAGHRPYAAEALSDSLQIHTVRTSAMSCTGTQ
jgi:hypothetical protein